MASANVIPFPEPDQPDQPSGPYDYSKLSPALAKEVKVEADCIHAEQREMVRSAIIIGHRLTKVKAKLPHGEWLPWLAGEFNMSERTAYKYMEMGDFQSNYLSKLAADANIEILLPKKAFQEVAKPSTPAPVKEAVAAKVEAGEAVTAAEVETMSAEHLVRTDGTDEEMTAMESGAEPATTVAKRTRARKKAEPKPPKPDKPKTEPKAAKVAKPKREPFGGLDDADRAFLDAMFPDKSKTRIRGMIDDLTRMKGGDKFLAILKEAKALGLIDVIHSNPAVITLGLLFPAAPEKYCQNYVFARTAKDGTVALYVPTVNHLINYIWPAVCMAGETLVAQPDQLESVVKGYVAEQVNIHKAKAQSKVVENKEVKRFSAEVQAKTWVIYGRQVWPPSKKDGAGYGDFDFDFDYEQFLAAVWTVRDFEVNLQVPWPGDYNRAIQTRKMMRWLYEYARRNPGASMIPVFKLIEQITLLVKDGGASKGTFACPNSPHQDFGNIEWVL